MVTASFVAFEETVMRAIVVISLSAGFMAHFVSGVPWFPVASHGGAPLPFMLAIGTGLPVLFVFGSHVRTWFSGKTRPSKPSREKEPGATVLPESEATPSEISSRDLNTVDDVVNSISTPNDLPVLGKLQALAGDEERVSLLEARMRKEFTPEMAKALGVWANYNKGLKLLLQQFSRARPGKQGPTDIEESWGLLVKAAMWRHSHRIPEVFSRGYHPEDRLALKQRFLNSFFFGHVHGTGEPIYYNNMALGDLDHADLVPGSFSINDLSIVWVQEMEYRERVIFPARSRDEGRVVNYMYCVFDVHEVGMGRLSMLKYMKATASLNSAYYPDSVTQILVVNCPGIITWLYSFVKPFVPETTQKKIVFTSGNGYDELLSITKDPAMIPRELGGAGPPRAHLVEQFQSKLQSWLEHQPGYDAAPDEYSPARAGPPCGRGHGEGAQGQGESVGDSSSPRDPELRAALQDLAVKDDPTASRH